MRRLALLTLILAVAGCGGGKHRQEARQDRADERRDDRHDKIVEDNTGWDKLGERTVHGGADHDVILVGGREGSFTRIKLVVEHSSLVMHDVDVFFGDGSHEDIGTRLVFGEDTRSRTIDLRGGKRVIKRVSFKYSNIPGGGKAHVELWAR